MQRSWRRGAKIACRTRSAPEWPARKVFSPARDRPIAAPGAPAGRAGDRYGAWVSELGPVAQGMAIRPATIEDAGEVVRLAALMYEAMGLDVTGTALGFGPGANPGLRIRW